ncbi:hypothetical protein [Vallitalea guaymasensis]|uniref:hypothetical protein n=1 Tax=Vallitalea guaymasensis TaxID=1185412 RepID=UPI000DE54CF2|nr:hypothetical protein [Vallitalea guaymasensis]
MFKVGDFFEVSGRRKFKVIFADEEMFICLPLHHSPGIGLIAVDKPMIFSNRGNLEDKYWIRKIAVQEHKPFSLKEL